MRVGFLHSLIRKEEKLLLAELAKPGGVEVVMLDDRKMIFDLKSGPDVDVVLERCINHSRALHGLRLLESLGIRCVNSYRVADVCGDKLLTSLALEEIGVAQPEVRVAFTEASALEALDDIGYPAVLKPPSAPGAACSPRSTIVTRPSRSWSTRPSSAATTTRSSTSSSTSRSTGATSAASSSATSASPPSTATRRTGSRTPHAARKPRTAR